MPPSPRAANRAPLVINQRPIDATPTPPPENYAPANGAEPTTTPAATPAVVPAVVPVASNGVEQSGASAVTTTPADSAPESAADSAADEIAPSAAGQLDDETSPSSGHHAGDGDDDADADADDDEYTYASESQVQAARLAMRAFAKARDVVPMKAAAARDAISGLVANGGNDAQIAMVLADARVKGREIGIDRHGNPTAGAHTRR